jgi:CheY-like chemotaxis protein
MMPRRSFLRHAIFGAAGLAALPNVLAPVRRPSLWIADSEPSVAFTIQLLARHCGFAEVHTFECKRTAIRHLQTVAIKPTLFVTDYWSGQMRGSEFIRLARDAAPATKVILFSAVVGNFQRWIAVAGSNAPRSDAIAEKPNGRKLMSALCQM